MYRLIASDMDETMLGAGHRLPAENVAALERLKEELCGRGPCAL